MKNTFVTQIKIVLSLIIMLLVFTSVTKANAEEIIIKANGKNHVDLFHIEMENDKPKLYLSEDITGRKVLRSPESVILEVSNHAYHNEIPQQFPGAPNAYVLPQSGDDPNILWPGWDTMGIAKKGYKSTNIIFENVQGPGQIHIYQSTLENPVMPVLTNSNTLITNGSQILEKEPTHKHVTWTFTKPGRYIFTAKVSVQKDGKYEKIGKGTYTINVDSKKIEKDNQIEKPKKQVCRAGYEKKLANDGKYYCVNNQGTIKHEIKDEKVKTQGKICKPVLEQKQAKPGDRIKTISSIVFNVGSNSGITHGHFDLGSAVIDNQYLGRIKDDNQGVWVSPESRVFALNKSSKITLPAGLESIGHKGQNAWMIDQTQKSSIPWIGVNTQHPSLLQNTTGNVTFQMNYVGPGKVALVEGTSFGKTGRILLGAGGSSSWTVRANTHTHPNWFFTAPGQYRVIITQTTVATTNLIWNDLVGKDENGNDCNVSLPQTVAGNNTVINKTQENKETQEEKEVLKPATNKGFAEQAVKFESNSYVYYILATIGIIALISAIAIFVYSFRITK